MDRRVIHESAYFEVSVLDYARLVRVARRPRPFESQEATNAACEPVQQALDALGRRSHRLLIDSRGAIGNNSPAYEQWFAAHRQRMVIGFERVAILVKTPIGKLHADRLVSEEKHVSTRVFLDEDLAVTFLEA